MEDAEDLEKELFGESEGEEEEANRPASSLPDHSSAGSPKQPASTQLESDAEYIKADAYIESENLNPSKGGLFGDESEEEEAEDESRRIDDTGRSGDQSEEEAEDEDMDEPDLPDVVMYQQVPDIGLVEHPDNLFLAKLPNFLNIDAVPFDPKTYEPAAAEENLANVGDEGDSGSRSVRLKVGNTIRWMESMGKESNARIIRWSDDSYSLLLGEELFDISRKDISLDHTYLLANYSNDLLQTQTQFINSMTFRPHSTRSATHKKLTQAIANKHKKVNRTKMISSLNDPEQIKLQAEKAENEKLKARRRLEAKRRTAEYSMTSSYLEDGMSARPSSRRPYPGAVSAERSQMDEYDLEDDFVAGSDEEEEEPDYGDDEEDSDSEGDREKLLSAKAHASRISDSEEEDEESPKGNDEGSAAKPSTKRLRIDEDEEED